MNAVGRFVCLGTYHGITRWLPAARNPSGNVWRLLREWTAGPLLAGRGRHINIEHGANIGRGDQLYVGSRSSVGINASVHGPVTIGDDVMMGPDVQLIARGHSFARTDVPIIDQGYDEPRRIQIGDDVWIGARAIILPGVRIGTGAVVGAGAVVTRDVPDFAVVAGNPARVVRSRLP